MNDWCVWVWLHTAQQNGSLAQWAASIWMGIGMVVTTTGAGGLLSLLLESIEEERLSDKQAAGYVDLKAPKFSAVRSGERPLTLQRIDKLPRGVLARLGEKLALLHGDEVEMERRARLYMALLLKKQMVKAQIASVKQEVAS